jgi:hypothetical protein
MSSRLRIIVTGLIAQHPLGGVAWDYVQYAAGLARLGHDVVYLEDSGQWLYTLDGGPSPDDRIVRDPDRHLQNLEHVLARFGLSGRWAYFFPANSRWYGLTDVQRKRAIASADLLINVSGTLKRPDKYRCIRRLAYIDSDPGFTQVKVARGQKEFRQRLELHDVHFSFGECLPGNTPATDQTWRPTRQPILLSEWRPATPRREVFTTVMNWSSYRSVRHGNHWFGQKKIEFLKFLDLPRLVAPATLEIAVRGVSGLGGGSGSPLRRLARKGWRVANPTQVCPDLESYRNYVESSKAEWTVAKNGYVVADCGWFSCRSACYLAAGRPVVVQETGFSKVLPVGQGILPFRTLPEAAEGVREVEAHYARHSEAARALAEEYFDSNKVLPRLVEQAMNERPHTEQKVAHA